MEKISLRIGLVLLLLFAFNEAKAQWSVSYFGNSSNSKVGVGYDFSEKLWAELRIYSDLPLYDITVEGSLNYNFVRRDQYRTYVGLGMVLNEINGIFLPLGVQVSPFENLRNFSFHIELQIIEVFDYNDTYLNGYWGLRYRF